MLRCSLFSLFEGKVMTKILSLQTFPPFFLQLVATIFPKGDKSYKHSQYLPLSFLKSIVQQLCHRCACNEETIPSLFIVNCVFSVFLHFLYEMLFCLELFMYLCTRIRLQRFYNILGSVIPIHHLGQRSKLQQGRQRIRAQAFQRLQQLVVSWECVEMSCAFIQETKYK